MRIYKCPKCNHLDEYKTSNEETDERRFISACHAMQTILSEDYYGKMDEHAAFTANKAVAYADALIAELEKK